MIALGLNLSGFLVGLLMTTLSLSEWCSRFEVFELRCYCTSLVSGFLAPGSRKCLCSLTELTCRFSLSSREMQPSYARILGMASGVA